MFTKKSLLTVAAVLMIAAFAVVGTVVYAFLKPTATASRAIEAIPIQLETTTSATGSDNTATQPINSDESELIVFEIDPAASTAKFEIDEVLNGSPFLVVGATSQVAGQIAIDPSDPRATQLGVIQINARTLATDSSQRDRAIQNMILSTNQYEFVTFTPSEMVGLPTAANVGETYTFQIKGELTIRDTARPATFTVSVTPTADNRLEGTATTTINYADWGVSIPSVPFVASVADEVHLTLAFAATSA